MLLLGIKNTSSQEVITDGLVNLGNVYRRYCKKDNCGAKTFDFAGDSVTLNQAGIYQVIVSATFTETEAGDVTLQLFENGEAITGALATETITTADTEVRSISFPYLVLVDKACVCGVFGVVAKSLSLVNTGVPATITNVSIAITKVC